MIAKADLTINGKQHIRKGLEYEPIIEESNAKYTVLQSSYYETVRKKKVFEKVKISNGLMPKYFGETINLLSV